MKKKLFKIYSALTSEKAGLIYFALLLNGLVCLGFTKNIADDGMGMIALSAFIVDLVLLIKVHEFIKWYFSN